MNKDLPLSYEQIYVLGSQRHESTSIEMNGISVDLEFLPSKLCWSLKADLFYGENYIPPSVREAVHSHKSRGANLVLYENLTKVTLEHLIVCANSKELEGQLIEFIEKACLWRERLWERGERDLLYVRVS